MQADGARATARASVRCKVVREAIAANPYWAPYDAPPLKSSALITPIPHFFLRPCFCPHARVLLCPALPSGAVHNGVGLATLLRLRTRPLPNC